MDTETNKRLGERIFELANGDIAALSEIYTVTCKILYAVGNIYLKQKADIEDAIQNLLIKLVDVAKKFKKNANACSWIISVYRHSIMNGLKRKSTEEKFLSAEKEKLKSGDGTVDETYLENHVFFRELFNKLTRREQELMINKYICGFSLSEIAKIENKPKSTIESRLKRLEEKIKKL